MINAVYPFLLNMWVMNRISEEKVRSYSPRFLTSEEIEMIIATPQMSK